MEKAHTEENLQLQGKRSLRMACSTVTTCARQKKKKYGKERINKTGIVGCVVIFFFTFAGLWQPPH
jgi:hypothetical protein